MERVAGATTSAYWLMTPVIPFGSGTTLIVLVTEMAGHVLPVEVNVNVIAGAELRLAVYVAVPGVDPELDANVPSAADQTAPVAAPPKEPPNAAEIPP